MHVYYETGLSGFRVSHVTYISGWIAQEVSGTYAGRSRARQPVNCSRLMRLLLGGWCLALAAGVSRRQWSYKRKA